MIKLKDLPIGSKIKFGKYQVETEEPEDIIWLIVDKNHEGYPDNSCTLITEKLIDVRAFDGRETNDINAQRFQNGNNFYKVSNINQWLNSNALSNWYAPQHELDSPPTDENVNNNTGYDTHSGFLYNFTKKEQSILLDTKIIFSGNIRETEDFYQITAKIFLPSKTEVGLGNEKVAEGSILSYFEDKNNRKGYLTKQCIDNTRSSIELNGIDSPTGYILRTPNSNNAFQVRSLAYNGNEGTYPAYNGNFGIRPICNIPLDSFVLEEENSYYKIIIEDKPKYCLYKKGGK